MLPAQLQDFGAYVDSARKTFDVPGIAVAIVKDGKVVMEQGFGLREIGKPDKVDAHTLFAIASNTKAFTAASLQQLAEAGKLKMDDRVIDHLPWFRMSDPYVTHEMRIRDLLAHRSGLSLGAGDLLYWPPTSYTTKEVVERLRHVPIKNGFRSGYAYDNILFAVATLVIEQASGQSYADYVRDHLFEPVGMDESLIDKTYLKPGMDYAMGHAKFDFKDLKTVPPMAWLNDPGAGGIYASVHDLAKWMNVQLAGGVLPTTDKDGKPQRFFSARQPAADVVDADPDRHPQAADSRAGAVDPALLRLRRRLVSFRLPRPAPGLAYRRLAGHGLARDAGARAAPGRGGADQPGIRARPSMR